MAAALRAQPVHDLPIAAAADPAYPYSAPGTTSRARTGRCSRSPPRRWRAFSLAGRLLGAEGRGGRGGRSRVAVLVALLARELGRDPARAVAFVALNPLVLVYGVGGVHNDVFFMALLLGGALLALNRREVLGGGAWAAAAAIKLSAGLAIPILVAGSRRRGRAAAGVALGGAARARG